ncbi:MAG TPA: UDP-N-acetylmuramoyl-L-alanine--D-glutamate ligase [Nevskiaceae bacterium]|nr:UDP-N-acetylmuramoyl-L-alanine--D-glutamate ligase [Nevskiaceae bacterium]
MNVAIVGYGVEGQSALAYWQELGDHVTVCDQNESVQVARGVDTQLGANYLHNLDRFDVIVRSAGINPDILLADNPGIKGKITTVINEFLRVCPTKNTIGITGTKGKGTTSTLIAKMLAAAGEQVFLAGNIGSSPLDLLPKLTPQSWVVLELSSFQLSDLAHSTHIALCLMVMPEHLNWHKDMDDYILAKAHLFEHQTPADTAIYFAKNDDSKRIASYSKGFKMPYFADPGAFVAAGKITIANQNICDVGDLKLLGKHNWQNVCAALTVVWQITQDIAAMQSVLTTFTGLEHRLEFVRELQGVKYYDDSFGTTPETAIVAIEAFQQPKVVILGGSDKGASYDALAQTVKNSNVRQVILIGQTGPAIEAALSKVGFGAITPGGNSIEAIVAAAHQAAQPGDMVLLSPACASLDMFLNYKERGKQFKAAVQALV